MFERLNAVAAAALTSPLGPSLLFVVFYGVAAVVLGISLLLEPPPSQPMAETTEHGHGQQVPPLDQPPGD